MGCSLCGGKIVYQGLTNQECETSSCPNFSKALKDTVSPPPTDSDYYADWQYDEAADLWYKVEIY